MLQVIQLVGAVLVLAAFVAAQAGVWAPHNLAYLTLNVVGAGLLAVLALLERQWGFLLLEAVWTAVSAWSLVARLRGRPVPGGAH